LGKKKSFFGRFWSSFFQHFYHNLRNLHTVKKNYRFSWMRSWKWVSLSQFFPSIFHSCNPAIWNLKMFRNFYF
jgi:hypothetical protein